MSGKVLVAGAGMTPFPETGDGRSRQQTNAALPALRGKTPAPC